MADLFLLYIHAASGRKLSRDFSSSQRPMLSSSPAVAQQNDAYGKLGVERMRAPIRSLCSLFLASFVMSGCENPEYWSFKEEVKLNNGQHIFVKRKLRRNNVWPHISADGYRVVVDDWISEPSLGIEWHSSLQSQYGSLLSIGVLADHVYIVAAARGIDFCRANPHAYDVAIFQKTAVGWQVIDQSNELLSSLPQNIMLAVDWGDPSEPKPELLSISAKAKRDDISPPAIRSMQQYLESQYWAKCETKLKNYYGNSSAASAPASGTN